MPSPGDKRIGALFDTLANLSQSLVGTHEGGGLADTLDTILGATGCGRGAAYTMSGGALVLVAARGLPATLRPAIERLPLAAPPSFIAQQAALAKGLVVDRAAASFGTDLAKALIIAGWSSAVACPIVAEGHVYGVIVLAASAEALGAPALATLQVACNLVALQTVRRSLGQSVEAHRSGDVRSLRHHVRGMLAGAVAADLAPTLATIERGLTEQQRRLDEARMRAPSDSGTRDLARLAAGAAAAAGQAKQSAERLRVATQAGPAELVDLGRAAKDALALAAPILRSRKIELQARCPEGHLVVGRRGELMELVAHVLLNVAGVLEDPRASIGEAMAERTLDVEVARSGAQVVLRIHDASQGEGSARSRLLAAPTNSEHGQGFAVAREIVIAHRGHIELGPAGKGGVRCDIVLPAATAAQPRAPQTATSGVRKSGTRPQILWIDDELSAQIITQSLSDCEVHVAGSAAEATQLLFKMGTMPTAIFCSLRLPDRPGHELHGDIEGFSPELANRFVFIADGLLGSDVASYLVKSGCPTLMRPIQLEQVRELAFADEAAACGAPTLGAPPETVDPKPARADSDRAASPRRPAEHHALDTAPTDPMIPAVRVPDTGASISRDPGRTTTLRSNGASLPSPEATRPAMGEAQLRALATATAEALRQSGPTRGPAVLEMLRGRGLSESEAVSVVMHGLTTGTLVRDPPWSIIIKAAPTKARKSVLVVDDDDDVRDSLRDVLEEEGYTVETAENGRQALEKLRSGNDPNRIVVLDLNMPVMDGWEFLRVARADPALVNIPVLVVSAKSPKNVGEEFLPKPVNYHTLLATVERLSKRSLRAAS